MYAVEVRDVWKSFMLHHQRIKSISDALINIFKMSFSREVFWALRGISFQLEKGEILGIIGPNGSGKTTILKLISKVLHPNRGSIVVNGRVAPLITAGAGFHHELTGRENVYLNGIVMGMKKREIARKFDTIVEFSGVGKFIDIPLKRYAPGMYLRLGFSITTHVEPDILLVDEILAVGDTGFQKKCLNKIMELRRNGTAIIFVSHNLEMIEDVCRRALFLLDGEVQYEGKPLDAIRAYRAFFEKNRQNN